MESHHDFRRPCRGFALLLPEGPVVVSRRGDLTSNVFPGQLATFPIRIRWLAVAAAI